MKILRAKGCSSCAYSHKAADPNGRPMLECRAAPPSVHPIIGADRQGNPAVLGHVTSFPIVNADVWCGCHKALLQADAVDLIAATNEVATTHQ